MSNTRTDPRARIPSINTLATLLKAQAAPVPLPHETSVRLARMLADRLRSEGRAEVSDQELADLMRPLLHPGPRRVINGTGILLHTNLGRAPLSQEVVGDAVAEVKHYTNLELDLESGKRGHRDAHFADLARLVWDCEDATLVNNAAAAVTLSLAAMGGGGETVVSRGEMIEIGGSFRLPDIMKLAGTKLVEVGTTNKTKPNDYDEAVTPETACFLKSHASNYRIEGFTRSVSLAELTELGRHRQVPVIMDLGSGLSRALQFPEVDEPFIEDYLADKPDLLIFSGDKLFGGVQAGIILGTRAAVTRVRKHPMMRMLRCDKLSISILCRQLAATVLGGRNPMADLALATMDALKDRAQKMAVAVTGLNLEVTEDDCYMGGGSLPQEKRPSVSLICNHPKPDKLAARLRTHNPPVMGYIRNDRFQINMAALFPEDDAVVIAALNEAAQSSSSNW